MTNAYISTITAAAASIDKAVKATVGDYWTIGDSFAKYVAEQVKAGEDAPSQRGVAELAKIAQSKISRGVAIRGQFKTAAAAMKAFGAFDGGITAWLASFATPVTPDENAPVVDVLDEMVAKLTRALSADQMEELSKKLHKAAIAARKAAAAA
jgi:hypothetical protein